MSARAVLPTCVVLAFVSPGVALAQEGDSAHAEALFNTAMRLQDARMYEEACPKFAESKHIAPGVGVTLHLADCYERLGRKASALHEFREAQKMALERHDKRADVAAAHASALEPLVNQLTIAGAPAEGTTGTLDGEPVSVDNLGKPIPVDPGDHTVTITSPGQPARTFSAHVEAGALLTTVAVDSPGPAPAPPTIVPLPSGSPPAMDADLPARAPTNWIGAELMGVGLAGLGIGAILVPANKMNTDTDCDPSHNTLRNWVPSIIAFSAGAVALTGGLLLYLSAPKRKTVAAAVVVAPTPLPGGGGATVQASF
ncbi:MAG: hypothetical protein ACLP1X_11945 [Polyangiaceae bacterium]|jgi:hypothetical protein